MQPLGSAGCPHAGELGEGEGRSREGGQNGLRLLSARRGGGADRARPEAGFQFTELGAVTIATTMGG